jgi:phosphoglycerol transferase MdoB-like AlkP superfamily enzyme
MPSWILPAAFLVGAVAEACAAPPLARRALPLLLAGLLGVALALLLLAVLGRPTAAAAATALLLGIVVAVSNTKVRVLREPLVFIDFFMLGEIVRHPQLFVPQFGVAPTIGLVAAVLGGLAAALTLEAPLPALAGAFPGERLLLVLLGIGLLAGTLRLLQGRLMAWGWRLRPSLHPAADLARFGLFGSLLLGALLFGDRRGKRQAAQSRRRVPRRPARLPDIVAVQAESFIDARRVDRRIPAGLLPAFDACRAGALLQGRLTVPGWGAYTQRSEFAFLTGLGPAELGLDRYNPYARFARRQPVWSIAHELRAIGYRTVCLHPFSGLFFGRDRAVPNLGFERFLDGAAFAGAPRFGPYVGDLAVAEKAIELLRESAEPLFIFAITMENHGSWKPRRLPAAELAALRKGGLDLPPGFLCYLRHLANADGMIGRLSHFLGERGDGLLCLFGDHVPSFPGLFRRLGYEDPRTDYLVWRAGQPGEGLRRDLEVTDLAASLMAALQAGPAAAPFGRAAS